MGCQEFAHVWREHQTSEKGIDIDPKPAAHGHGGARRLNGGIFDAGKVWLHLLIEASPFLGERDGARRAVEQPDADAVLEPGDRAADAGLCGASSDSAARTKLPASTTAARTPIPLSSLPSNAIMEADFQSPFL